MPPPPRKHPQMGSRQAGNPLFSGSPWAGSGRPPRRVETSQIYEYAGRPLGRRQVGRHWILIPAFEGSIPSAPANLPDLWRTRHSGECAISPQSPPETPDLTGSPAARFGLAAFACFRMSTGHAYALRASQAHPFRPSQSPPETPDLTVYPPAP